MSYLSDKVECQDCGQLFDPDLISNGICRDCELDNEMLEEIVEDERQ